MRTKISSLSDNKYVYKYNILKPQCKKTDHETKKILHDKCIDDNRMPTKEMVFGFRVLIDLNSKQYGKTHPKFDHF